MSVTAHKLRRVKSTSTAYTLANVSHVSTFRPSPGTGTYWGCKFKPDGTKALISAGVSGTQYLREYSLSTAWSVNTMSLIREVNITGTVPFSGGIDFNSDGTKLFVVNGNFDTLNSYDLSTPYSIVSLTNFNSGDTLNNPLGCFYVQIAGVPTIFHVNDTTPLVSRVSVTGDNPDNTTLISTFVINEAVARNVTFSPDGLVMLVTDNATDSIYQYNLTTGFDITTASYSGLSFDTSLYTPAPTDVVFGDDGKKLLLSSFRDVHEFDLV